MADLKSYKGFTVQNLSADPTPYADAPASTGVWSSGGNINVVRRSAGTFGTLTASVMVGGESPPTGYVKTTIEYDGSSWTLGNDSSRPGGFVSTGAGILTAGWIAGGYTNAPPAGNQANTEHYDGTTWTEVADLSAAKVDGNTVGTTTAGLFSGGGDPATADSEEWNGSSWAEGNNMNSARKRSCGMNVGSQTAAACIGGDLGPAQTAKVENYDGTSWTEVTDMGTARQMGGAFGTTAAFAVAGGSYPAITTTEIWDGSSFSTGNSMAQARSYQPASGNSSTSGLYGGGAHPGSSANLLTTEEWTYTAAPGPAAEYTDAIVGDLYYNTASGKFKYVSAGTGSWASGGNLNTARDLQAGAGTQTAGIIAMGEPPVSGGAGVAVEEYDGSSWTSTTSLNTYRFGGGGSGGPGAQTSFLVFGGSQSSAGVGNTELWNGSSWTEKNDLNSARVYTTGTPLGTTTAALCIGGGGPGTPNSALTESFDGTNWTETGDLNTGRELESGVGTSTAALCVGGKQTWPGTSTFANVESFNGSTWSEGSDLNTARGGLQNGGAGTSTAAMVAGGETPTKVTNVETWDGTSWSEESDIPSAVTRTGGIGSSTAANISGGSNPSTQPAASSDWSVPAYSIKTVTVS